MIIGEKESKEIVYSYLVESAETYVKDLPIHSKSKSVQILSDVATLGQKVLKSMVIRIIIEMSEGSDFKA